VPPKEGATASSPFPFEMHSAAATYASSINTNMSAYEDLPSHHLISIRNLIASTPDDSYPESADDTFFFVENVAAPEWDYSGVRNLSAFLSFQAAADYCLTCSDNSSEGDYNPTRECFMVELADGAIDDTPSDDGNGEENPPANPVVVPPANQLLRQARPRGRRSWRNSRSTRTRSTRSVGRHGNCVPCSSRSAPRAVRELGRRGVSPRSGS